MRFLVSLTLSASVLLLFGCSKLFAPKEMTILIRMIDNQDQWFREKLKKFEEDNNVELHIVSFDRVSEVQSILEREKGSERKTVGLVKTQSQMLVPLVDKGLMVALDEIVNPEQLSRDLDEYTDVALEDGYVQGKQYYIPRKLEINTLLYLKPRVDEAVQGWSQFRPQIEAMFRPYNHYGLPRDFQLEKDPNEWDWYDLAVVSYYWAHTEYEGSRMPRTAHRGRKYIWTMTEIATKIFQAGGDSEALLFEGEKNIVAVYDAFEWEAFYRKNKLYNSEMWENRWTGADIWRAISGGKVFLVFLHQLDAFFIHGVAESHIDGYLEEPDHMGTAIMPKGVSLELDRSGSYVREGRRYSQRAGWWWGIPRTTPDPQLSYKLSRYITSKEFHLEEVTRFGMLPIRKDVSEMLEGLRDDPQKKWMAEVFDTARRQFEAGVEAFPRIKNWGRIETLWLEAWYEIVVEGNYSRQGPGGKVDREHIKRVLDGYATRIRELARESGTSTD